MEKKPERRPSRENCSLWTNSQSRLSLAQAGFFMLGACVIFSLQPVAFNQRIEADRQESALLLLEEKRKYRGHE